MTVKVDEPEAVAPAVQPKRRRREPGYGLVLMAIIGAILLVAVQARDPFGHFLAVMVLAAALLLALRTAQVGPRLMRRATLVVALALGGSFAALITGRATAGLVDSLTLVLVGLTPIVLAKRLVQTPAVTAQSLVGALCVYLMIGLFFGLIYSLTPVVSGVPFFVQEADPTAATYLYFSFVTLATVGYGDLVAQTSLGRMLSVTEALTGQLYLVTVVALLVSNYRQSRASS